MSISKIENHMFDYDNLKDVNLSPTLAARWALNILNSHGLCTLKVRDLVEGLTKESIYEHPFNRGLGGVYNSSTTNSIQAGFSALAFGIITAAIMENTNDDPNYPPTFLMLADAHNRCEGILRAYDSGNLTPGDLIHPLPVQIIPASQFIEIYGILNTCRSQTGAEKYTHPVLRYGAVTFKLAQRAGISNVEKSFACQIAYLVEYYESNPIGRDTVYADTFAARMVTKKKALHRSVNDPIILSSGKESRLVAALQWLTSVRFNVNPKLGGKLLSNGPFLGMLLLWYLRNERKIGKTAKRFAKKLDNKAMELKPLMSCITHSGDSSIQSTEIQILKIL